MKGLTEKQADEIRKELDECSNPLFFFHDDADGVCSFLQMYRYKQEGHGVIIKSNPKITALFMRKVEEYNPDKIFLLDLAMMEEEFVEAAKRPIIWIDHHDPVRIPGVKTYNPHLNNKDDSTPASYLCYQVCQRDLWLAMAGCIGDWHIPDIAGEFSKEYPELLPEDVKKPEQALFATEFGRLVKMIGFVLKGKTTDVNKAVKIMTRIESPEEILKQTTSRGRLIHKMFEHVNEKYDRLMVQVKKAKPEGEFLVFTYPNGEMSFTKDLSNEVLYENPDKVIIIGRETDGELKLSLRATNYVLPPILEKALRGIEGYGGGHEHACGVCVKTAQFDTFLEQLKDEMNNSKK